MSSLIKNAPQSETHLQINYNRKECVHFKEEHQENLCNDCASVFSDVFEGYGVRQ